MRNFFVELFLKALFRHPKLAWVNATMAKVNDDSNAISLDENTKWYFKFGRVCSMDFVTLARVHFKAKIIRFMDSDGYQSELKKTSEFQLLTCLP